MDLPYETHLVLIAEVIIKKSSKDGKQDEPVIDGKKFHLVLLSTVIYEAYGRRKKGTLDYQT